MLVKDFLVMLILKLKLICFLYYNLLNLEANLAFYKLLLKKLLQLVLAATF
jgi:hypothetical protein